MSENEDDISDHWGACGRPGISQSVVRALDDLPVLERLKFVKNLIFDHGGAKESVPQDPVLVVATEVLSEVIVELEKGPIGERPVELGPADEAARAVHAAKDKATKTPAPG
jgi:hypothetical protein